MSPVGVDGLTNEQWIEVSRPTADKGLADKYKDQNKDDENEDGPGKRKTTTDAGHGNNGDSGAVDGTSYEKDYALNIESWTDFWLNVFGIDNNRTRTGDVKHKDGFTWRYGAANEHGSELFVSFHLNGGTTSDAVYIVYQQGKSNEKESIELANVVARNLSGIMNVPSNAVVSAKERTRFTNLAVLNGFNGKAGILVEFGSVQNSANRGFLDRNSWLVGYHVAAAMYQYLFNKPPVPLGGMF